MRPKVVKPRIDWPAQRATLAARTAASAVTATETARAERLLGERTRALAATSQAAGAATRALMVRVGAERYALPLAASREVVEIGRVAALPGVHGALLGLINWRGEFIAAFDLAALFGCQRAAPPRRAVVLAQVEPPLALAVDTVEHIAGLDMAQLRPSEQLAPDGIGLFRGALPDGRLVIDEAAVAARLKGELRVT
jgi:chemotaxis signal transduction protein